MAVIETRRDDRSSCHYQCYRAGREWRRRRRRGTPQKKFVFVHLECHGTGDAREEGVVRDADVMEDGVGGPATHHGNELGSFPELEESGGAAGAERVSVETGRGQLSRHR